MKTFLLEALRRSLVLVFLVFVSNQLLIADNWNTGSGGNSSRNCQTSESGPIGPEILWQNGVNAIISQQPVIDGNIVAMSRIVNLTNIPGTSVIVAQNLTTGDTLWTRKLPVDFPATDWGSRVSAFRNGVIYATRSGNSNNSYMYALNATTGEIIWKSEDLVNESSTESCAFAANGDLIVGNFTNIMRINAVDGSTVWETDRVCPTTNGQEVSIFGNKGYYWEAAFYGPVVSVIDLDSGQYLYSSESLSAGYIQQLCLMVGPDGTIYAPRSMNNGTTDFMIALEDKNGSFAEKWRTPIGFIPFSTSGVGPDGSVYTYSAAGEIIRLNPENGEILNTSIPVFTNLGSGPRMAIDANWNIFVTNSESATGALFCFGPNLTLLWSDNILNLFSAGPAIGEGGTLVIAAAATVVRAYKGLATYISAPEPAKSFSIYPNPIVDEATLDILPEESGNLEVMIFTYTGSLVYSGSHTVVKNMQFTTGLPLNNCNPGMYILKTMINGRIMETSKIIKK